MEMIMKKMKKLTICLLTLSFLGGCTGTEKITCLEYHKWIPIQQSDSSLKNQGKEVKVPSQK